MDDIIQCLTQLAVNNLDLPPHTRATIEEVTEALNQLSMSDGLGPPSSPLSNYTYPLTSQPPEDNLDQLVFLDNQLDSHIRRILQYLDSLADPNLLSQP